MFVALSQLFIISFSVFIYELQALGMNFDKLYSSLRLTLCFLLVSFFGQLQNLLLISSLKHQQTYYCRCLVCSFLSVYVKAYTAVQHLTKILFPNKLTTTILWQCYHAISRLMYM